MIEANIDLVQKDDPYMQDKKNKVAESFLQLRKTHNKRYVFECG